VKDLINIESHEEDHKQVMNDEETEYFYKLWEEDRL
jgi:hypothetical protein